MSPSSAVFPADLVSALIKAYDVRGLVDEQITPEFVTAVGAAFVEALGCGRPVRWWWATTCGLLRRGSRGHSPRARQHTESTSC
jgi:hypothetical protein